MANSRTSIASVVECTRPVAADGVVVGVHFLQDTAVFVLGEEALLMIPKGGEKRRLRVHTGAILAAASDGKRVITGGDDGQVAATDASGATTVVAADQKRRWIDQVAAGPDGAVAWSAGKQAFVCTATGDQRAIDTPSTVGGLAFAPKGFRLAVAHYNGATLWFPHAAQAAPERLEWKGSHLGVTFSPDGRFLVTTMQEPTLHGWRLADRKHMRMSGYAAKVLSVSWTADGKALATSGAKELIIWPFQSKEGPMGKAPKMLAQYTHDVVSVACHAKEAVVAIGYGDGLVLLARIDDGAEILAKNPGKAPITALAWNTTGTLFAFGSEDGQAGIVSLG